MIYPPLNDLSEVNRFCAGSRGISRQNLWAFAWQAVDLAIILRLPDREYMSTLENPDAELFNKSL
jgi:hypothetical protein